MNQRMNYMRAITFKNPEYIPMDFVINPSCFQYYDPDKLFDLMEKHPFLFPDFKRPSIPYRPKFGKNAMKNAPYRDSFGCLWETTMDGIVGTVTDHPLKSWDDLKSYVFPNPDLCNGLVDIDWEKEEIDFEARKKTGKKLNLELRHGHTFLQLCDIRGYENLLFDMEDEDTRLLCLIQKLEDFNLKIIEKFIKMRPDIIMIPEDLGMQVGPMLSPDNFKKYILPSYKKYIQRIQSEGIRVHMHSDGDIRTLVDGLITDGVDALNLQDLVNGIDWIKENLKGKVCLDIDIDRQSITPYKTPKDIEDHIRNITQKLYDKRGGLTMVYGLYPGVPLENVEAVMDAMEKYAYYKGDKL